MEIRVLEGLDGNFDLLRYHLDLCILGLGRVFVEFTDVELYQVLYLEMLDKVYKIRWN